MATEETVNTNTAPEDTTAVDEAPKTTSLMDELEGEKEPKDDKPATEEKPDEGKTEGEGEKTEGDKEGEKEEDKPEGAPEAYEDFRVEEGIALNPELVEEFKGFAKEANLPQDKAQGMVDMAVKLSKDWHDKAVSAFAETREGWRTATKTDPEIGGAKLNEVLSGAKAVRDAFGSPGLTEVLNQFGLGDHPEVVRFFHNVRQAVSEDKLVKDGKPTADRTAAEVLFGETMKPKQAA